MGKDKAEKRSFSVEYTNIYKVHIQEILEYSETIFGYFQTKKLYYKIENRINNTAITE